MSEKYEGEASARAYIAALEADLRDTVRRRDGAEAERDALKCCGNCGRINQWGDETSCEAGRWIHTMPNGRSFETGSVGFGDECHFTPSRWAERIAP